MLNPLPLAPRTAARSAEPLPLVKNVLALQTSGRDDHQPATLRNHGACDVGKMPVDLFLLNAQYMGEIQGAMRCLGQQRDHLLANGLHRRLSPPGCDATCS